MDKLLLMIPALLAGSMIPFQTGINGKLGKSLNHPLQATYVSFFGGLITISIVLIAMIAFMKKPMWPTQTRWDQIPWYLYLGGPIGVVFVTAALTLQPRIGIANFLVAALAGQMVLAAVLDHYGLFGVPQSLGASRALGIALVIGGVLLVQKS